MNTQWLLRILIPAALAVGGCGRQGDAVNPNIDYYTCAMHPSVRSQDPKGKCPICAMDLVPVAKAAASPMGTPLTAEGSAGSQNSVFIVPSERQQQIGVTYAAVRMAPLHRVIRAVGYIVPDAARRWEFTARTEAYVEKLHVTSPGESVRRDQPLVTVYSPDLLVTQTDFVRQLEERERATTAEEKARAERALDAFRRRLGQWQITPEQTSELERNRRPSEFLTLASPFDGAVEDVPVAQGRRVMPGDRLVSVADLSEVWVWADFYENETAALRAGEPAVVTAPAYPGEEFHGTIALVSPFLDEMNRTVRARLNIPNRALKLRPGMFVNVGLSLDRGKALSIPVGAVMPTGSRSLVFVDKGDGRLEPRTIQIGGKFGDLYEVQSGLADGERVVAGANFLIDAESKVQGAVKSFEAPVSGESGTEPRAFPSPVPLPGSALAVYQPMIESYFALERALAHDDLDGATSAALQLRERADAVTRSGAQPASGAERYHARTVALAKALVQFKSGSLDEARVHFGTLSAALIALLTEFPPPLGRSVHVMNCSMWRESPGDWLQPTKEIQNPFMGRKMPGCGDVVRTLPMAK